VKLSLAEARDAYHRFLDEDCDQEAVRELAARLGLDFAEPAAAAEPDPAAAAGPAAGRDLGARVAAVVEELEKPGRLLDVVGEANERAAVLLLDLLDLGEVHPAGSLRHVGKPGEEAELTRAFLELSKLGLTRVVWHAGDPRFVIHPWVGHLLAEPVARLRRERLEKSPLEVTASPALAPLLTLVLNYHRGEPVRMTTAGNLYKRHLDRAHATFAALGPGEERPCFEFATELLAGWGALSLGAEGFLRVEEARWSALLAAPATDWTFEYIARRASWGFAPLLLLDIVEGFADVLPGGWTRPAHALPHSELFAEELLPGPFALRRGLEELALAGLLEHARNEAGSWYRLTASARDLLKRLGVAEADAGGDGEHGPPLAARAGADMEADADADADAVSAGAPKPASRGDLALVQPNLDVLVPLAAPPRIHWWAGAVARLETVDTVCRYRIEKRHALSIFSHGEQDPSAWMAGAKAFSSHGLPDNVEATLRGWLANVAPVDCAEGVLLRLAEEDRTEARAAAIAAAAQELGAKRVGPEVYLVPEAVKRSRLQRVLRAHGLCPTGSGMDSRAQRGDEEVLPTLVGSRATTRELALRLEAIRLGRADLQEELAGTCRPPAPTGSGGGDGGATRDTCVSGKPGEISLVLHRAVRNHRAVEIVLRGDESRTWILLPDAVRRRGSCVYVRGTCVETDEKRSLPLASITQVRLLEPEG
jgi:hypothetical protein